MYVLKIKTITYEVFKRLDLTKNCLIYLKFNHFNNYENKFKILLLSTNYLKKYSTLCKSRFTIFDTKLVNA